MLVFTWFHSRAYLIRVTSSWGSRLTWIWIIRRQNAARNSAGRFSLFVQLTKTSTMSEAHRENGRAYVRISSMDSSGERLSMAKYWRSKHIWEKRFSWNLNQSIRSFAASCLSTCSSRGYSWIPRVSDVPVDLARLRTWIQWIQIYRPMPGSLHSKHSHSKHPSGNSCNHLRSCLPHIVDNPVYQGRRSFEISLPLDWPGTNEDIRVLLQHWFTDHFLSTSNGLITRDTKIREIFEKSKDQRQHVGAIWTSWRLYLQSLFSRKSLTNVSISLSVMCFSNNFLLLCNRAVMVSSARIS